MTRVPQPPDLPDNLPAPVVAYIRALEATIAELTAQATGPGLPHTRVGPGPFLISHGVSFRRRKSNNYAS